MNKKYIISTLSILLSFIFVAPLALAADEMLSETWVMTAQAGQMDAMENALKKHVQHRKELKDPREWRIYSPVLGDNLDQVAVRSFGFSWAGMDSYRDWSKEKNPQKHWNENVDKNVANYQHYMSIIDTENSHWGPDVEYKYVGVTSYKVKMGHWTAINEDKKIMSDAAKAQNWPFNWSWAENVGGQGHISLAVPFKNWASMAPSETKFAEVLAKHLGDKDKAKEIFERWSSHFESISYDIYELRNDLME